MAPGTNAIAATARTSNASSTQMNQTGPDGHAPSEVHCSQKPPLVARAVVCRYAG